MAVGVNLTLMFPQGANDGVICFSGPLNMQEKYCARLTDEEALRFVVYDDATGRPIVPGTHVIGHPSIGIGRALDVHFGDKLADAMKAARAMQRGGVGWYPHSSFMHMDSGPVRNWAWFVGFLLSAVAHVIGMRVLGIGSREWGVVRPGD